MICHFALTYRWQHGANWLDSMEPYIANLGRSAVAIFFIITGFLFFGRVFAQGQTLRWRVFFISRIFRIYPLYLVVVAIIFLLSFIESGFGLNVSPLQLLKSVIQWLSFSSGPINGNAEAHVKIAHVEWTLRFEWAFYVALPFLAMILHRSVKLFLVIAFCSMVFCVFPTRIELLHLGFGTKYFVLFFAGALVAWLQPIVSNSQAQHWIDGPAVGAFCLTAWLCLILLFESSYGLIQSFILAAIVLPIVCGNSVLGLLSRKGSIALGEISYSIYLCHGLVLYLVFTTSFPAFLNTISFDQALWLLPATAIAVSAVSALTFVLVERPGISLGKSLGKKSVTVGNQTTKLSSAQHNE